LKCVLVGDPHFGKKNFSKKIFDIQIEFFREMFKVMQEKEIKICISMGDLFDNRSIIDINFFNDFVNEFIELLKEFSITFYNIQGNHDLYFRNRSDVSLVKHLNKFYDGFINIDEVTHLENLTLVPWIIDSKNDIPKEYNDFVLGHFEFKDIDKYIAGEIDIKTFSKAKMVFSGHYHNKSLKDNVMYIGTPYQLEWGDYEEVKGFYILDTDKNIEFIKNETSPMHIKLKYDDNNKKPWTISGLGEDIYFDELNEDILKILQKNIFNVYINVAKDSKYNEILYDLKQKNFEFEVLNNVELSELIDIKYDPKEKEILEEDIQVKGLEYIKKRLDSKLNTILNEVLKFNNEG